MVEAGRIHGVLAGDVEIDLIEQYLQYGSDDARTARRAKHQKRLAIADDDGGRHGGERPLAWLDGVGFTLDETEQIRRVRLRGEVVHFIVEKETQAGDGYAASVAVVERVSDG